MAPTTWLTGKHTIFGEVTTAAGQRIVDDIANAPADARTDRPVQDVVLESVTIETRQG